MNFSHLLQFSPCLFTEDVEPSMDMLVAYLNDDDVDIQLYAITILRNMTYRPQCKVNLVEAHGLESLMRLMSTTENMQIRKLATAVVCNLSFVDSVDKAALVHIGMLDRLHYFVTSMEDIDMKLYAVAALINLDAKHVAELPNIFVHILDNPFLSEPSMLVQMLSLLSHTDESVRCSVARQVYEFVSNTSCYHDFMREMGAIPCIVRLLSDTVAEVKEHGVKMLHKLLTYPCAVTKAAIVDAGAIDVLASLLMDNNREVRSFAANVLLELSYFRRIGTGEC
jgi:hypothetical protein